MATAKKPVSGAVAAAKIDELVSGLDDWRGERLSQIRKLILDAVDGVEETWKWMGSPVWEKDGIIAVGNAHKEKVKLTFPHGAQLPDPARVFNNGFNGKYWRAVDIHEGDELDAVAFQELVRQAAVFNSKKA